MKAAALVMGCAFCRFANVLASASFTSSRLLSVAALFIHELARNFSIWFKPHVTLFSR